MNLLSALLPGLRDLRVPLTVGWLWVAAFALVAAAASGEWDRTPGVQTIVELFTGLPTSAQFAVASLASYGIGIVLQSAVQSISGAMGRRWRARLSRRDREADRIRLPHRVWQWLYPAQRGTDALISRILSRTLPEDDEVPLQALVPDAVVLGEIDLAALALSKDHPDQFDQFDRLESEAEFRGSVALPVFVLGAVISSMLASWVWTPIALAATTGCALQLSSLGHRQHQEAIRRMVTVMALGWTTTPALTSIRERLNALNSAPEPGQYGEKVFATIAIVLDALPKADLATYMSRIRHPSRADVIRAMTDEQFSRLQQIGAGRLFVEGLIDPEKVAAMDSSQLSREAGAPSW